MSEKRRATLICVLLAAVTVALYWPAIHFNFVNYDDPEYIMQNSAFVRGLTRANVAWAFAAHASNWHPVTWLSHIVDCSLYGLHPGGHHATNVLIHAANAVLLFLLMWQLTGTQWRSALVAALFAWHPLHVESVAWVSERKDVLSGFFWLFAILAYVRYARPSPTAKIWCFPALLLFVLGLLSKPTVVTLPFVLLLLDFWPLRRAMSPGLFLEKIPFFVLAALDGIATFWAQGKAHSVVSLDVLPLSMRVANALISYVLYLWKMIWPADLATPYPYSHWWTFWPAAGAGLLLLAIGAGAMAQARRRPCLAVGWLWYLGTLLPMIGLVQAGMQPMADRCTYLPSIGIFIMLAWSVPPGWARWPRPGLVFGAVTAGALCFLLTGAEMQLQYWRDSVALFSHTAAVTRDNVLAEYNLAEALAMRGDTARAVVHYQRALAITPNRVEARFNSQTQAHFNLGLIYLHQKNFAEAAAQFRAFLRDDPGVARGHEALGLALKGLGRATEAQEQFDAAARLRNDSAHE